ncbi:DJ-1/PfpI family protein, partial [Francisella tularensis subsp. holarctica]|nr:DJ-1/PfpI family protein [Francisella tularensis subsp. holarctica]
MLEIVTILYDDFETLDVFVPIEVLGSFKDIFKINYYSINGSIVSSSQAVEINTKDFSQVISKEYV